MRLTFCSVCLSVCFSVCAPVCLFGCLSVFLSVCLSVGWSGLSVSVCLFPVYLISMFLSLSWIDLPQVLR